MRLPKDILTGGYRKPRIFLCETDKSKICELKTYNTNGSFKFNSYSELTFTAPRTYANMITGETQVNPFYNKIETPRLIYIEDFAYFEIQGTEISSDGIKEAKDITAYSSEYTLSQKFLEEFYTANGRDQWAGSLEDLWQVKKNDDKTIPKIVLYNKQDPDASILHLILEKVYGWKIGHVDDSLCNLSRNFDVDRMSVYDFIINEVCEKCNCYAVFDTIDNTISLYAESLSQTFIGDGENKIFTLTIPFDKVETVSIDGYKTTKWEYDPVVGQITLEEAPADGAHIEVIDAALTEWATDVFVSFDNLSQEVNVSYDADSIKTVLTITYGDDCDIREANLGLPYLTDISYYYHPDWMGQELYDAYKKYMQTTNKYQTQYANNSQEMLNIAGHMDFEENRLSLQYAEQDHINSLTVGTYYTRGGEYPNYYYTEVSLPSEYMDGVAYYKIDGVNLTEDSVASLYQTLQYYFYNYFRKAWLGNETSENQEKIKQANKGMQEALYNGNDDSNFIPLQYLLGLSDNTDKNHNTFNFIDSKDSEIRKSLFNKLADAMEVTIKEMLEDDNTSCVEAAIKYANTSGIEDAINVFLDEMWNQVGRTPLQQLYLEAYKKRQAVNEEAYGEEESSGKKESSYVGNSQTDSENYGHYYPVVLFINSINKAIDSRDSVINDYQEQYNEIQNRNSDISNELLLDVFFRKYYRDKGYDPVSADNKAEKLLIRLSAFLREDELQLDDIVETEEDSIADSFKNKQDAMESGRIELSKICKPVLQFSMNMANIYALPEFEPIIDRFQLGNVIRVALREDYIKNSRLLQVDINFDDFSDFTCEFGELTELSSQSDIHADLLKKAVQAGKNVATNSSYWTKGSTKANSTDLKIQQGLLDAVTSIKSMDATQGVEIDKYGIHLYDVNPNTGEKDDKQGWITNNKFLYSDDGFKTSKSVFGEYTVDGTTYYGLLAEAVIAGYIEGSKIVGTEINIGNGAFKVDGITGEVTMGKGSSNVSHTLDGYATTDDIDKEIKQVQDQIDDINNLKMYRVEIITGDSTIMSTVNDTATMICKVYSWDTDITNDLDSSIFNWKRTSGNEELDEVWNSMPEHQGTKTITINPNDVLENSSFTCEVDLPE